MKIGIITPTRSDRPELLEYCKKQVAQFDPAPHEHIIVDYRPKSSDFDLVARVREGIAEAHRRSCDIVVIVEDDDYYPTYFLRPYKQLRGNFMLAGDPQSIYYQLGTRSYTIHRHPGRASLFTTAINLEQWDGRFKWPAPNENQLDFAIWRHAAANLKKVRFIHTGAVGIKHMIGLCGGNGHRHKLPETDPNYAYLKSVVSADAFDFYMSLRLPKRR